MPIYAYKCDACGHAKDVLQKMSDAVLTDCPVCGANTFKKQLTAAGFQLKGSGWYVTDFKGGAAAAGTASESKADATPESASVAKTEASAPSGQSAAKSDSKTDTKPAPASEAKTVAKAEVKVSPGASSTPTSSS